MVVPVLQPRQISEDWLSAFADVLTKKDTNLVSSLFLSNGWFRDSLVLDWRSRSLEGPTKIAEYLKASLPSSRFENITLDDRTGLAPSLYPFSPEIQGVQFAFVFETPLTLGRGFVRLLLDLTENGGWKALSAYIVTDAIKGHEELGHELGLYGGHTLSWGEVKEGRRLTIENDPQALIVGAGQTGLQVAARFRQMGIRTIVIEKNTRVGDNWRKRYPTLTLHTPRAHHTLLYAPFPSNWPTFTPRDKVAAWLEQYAVSQELVVWTSTYLLPGPIYDASARRWTVAVVKDGTTITLHPSHIVLATGVLGDPVIPQIPSSDLFRGTTLHASTFKGGEAFSGKRVLVVGAGNTSADVCQDLVTRGAKEVTMLQRSETAVASAAQAARGINVIWPEGVSVDVSDFKAAAMPLGLLKKIYSSRLEDAKNFDRELHEGLVKNGLNLSYGPEGSSYRILVFERLGGYWIDVGLAELINEKKVKIRSGVEISRFTSTGVVLTDGTELQVDSVIYATGYRNIRPTMKKIFGDEVIDRTGEVWGLNEEGEIRGCYEPSGQPGLWYAVGDFFLSRYMSKQLALSIKSEELGLTSYRNLAADPYNDSSRAVPSIL